MKQPDRDRVVERLLGDRKDLRTAREEFALFLKRVAGKRVLGSQLWARGYFFCSSGKITRSPRTCFLFLRCWEC